MVYVKFPCIRSTLIKLLFAQTVNVPVLLCSDAICFSLFILSRLFPPSLFRSLCFVCCCTFCSFPLTPHLIVSLCPLRLSRYSSCFHSFTLPSSPGRLCSSLPPHLLSTAVGCCGCEEGRCSDSEMCESAESKAVSVTRSSLQVQDTAALCANVILLTNGIQSSLRLRCHRSLPGHGAIYARKICAIDTIRDYNPNQYLD